MGGSSMPTRDELADREDARCRRTYDAMTRVGHDYVLPLRWVDVMPQVTGPSLIDEAKRERLALEAARKHVKAAAQVTTMSEADKLRHRINCRASYERKRVRERDHAARWKVEREQIKAAQRTPEQQKRHDSYEALKARRKVES